MDVVDSSCISPNLRPREIPVDPDVVRHVMWLVPMFSMAIDTDKWVPRSLVRDKTGASERVRPPASVNCFPSPRHHVLTTSRYIERWQKQHGKRLDHDERVRKRQAREAHQQSKDAQNLRGLRAKLYQQKRHAEKIQMRKRIKAQEEKNVKSSAPDEPSKTPLPQYLLDRSQATNAKALSSAIKDKRKEQAAKFAVPLPKVKGISEEEMFKVVNTGKKTHKKSWKRMITKPTFVGNDFTRVNPKRERFIRPMGLRYKKANVTQYVLSSFARILLLMVVPT
ncbi:unnamed protein product [Aspergillus oryzae]|nr:unnamed protein product [Aspergillus oryzae]GMF95808.1 unnamed protein product [Aspergillus oryzae]